MNQNHSFPSEGLPPSQNGQYPDLDPLISPLYPWMVHQQHILPENIPSASRSLVFEGFIPDSLSQNISDSQNQQYQSHSLPGFNQTSRTIDSSEYRATHSPTNWVQSSNDVTYQSDVDSTMQDIDESDYATDAGVFAGTRSRRSGRKGRTHPASRKTGFRGRGGWSKGLKLGPRRTIEPSEEFNKLHQQATNAFIDEQDPEKAMILVTKAIAINPEIFSAHALLSEIYFSKDDSKLAIDTLFIGAHTCPRDADVWQQIADACLQRSTYDRETSLEQALYAFNRLVQIDHGDHDSRFQRAAIWKELGRYVKAVNELHVILQAMPYNSSVLKLYAEICIEWGNVEKALQLFKEAIQFYQMNGLTEEDSFTWSGINVYVDLVAQNITNDISTSQALSSAIKALKTLSRWLLGREMEHYWDLIEDDDREWDPEDTPRRSQIPSYEVGKFDQECYGIGLPLELRIKLGLLRLKQETSREEAIAHFGWLDPEDQEEDANVFHFSDLFRDVGFALHEAKEHDLALQYLKPLKDHDLITDISFWLVIADAFYVCGDKDRAMECYEEAVRIEEESIEANTWLSKLHTERGNRELAIKYAEEAIGLAQDSIPKTSKRKYERKDLRETREAAEAALKQAKKIKIPRLRVSRKRIVPTVSDEEPDTTRKIPKNKPKPQPKPKLKLTDKENIRPSKLTKPKKHVLEETEAEHRDRIAQFYTTLVNNTLAMRRGINTARGIWMDCAKSLITDFRRNRSHFSEYRVLLAGQNKGTQTNNSHVRFSKVTADHSSPAPYNADTTAQDDVLPSVESTAPATYQNISFSDWLDIFLEYAVLLANYSSDVSAQKDCYEIITAALDCTVWSHDSSVELQIYVCYLACALTLQDETTLFNTVLRWFMREFQFCTDAYRLFAAMNLLFTYPNDKAGKDGQMNRATFKSGPYQKFLFRQILSIDNQLPDDYNLGGHEGTVPDFMRKERGEILHTHRDDGFGNIVVLKPEEMDVVLLTIYAQVLYAAGSFLNALSYLYRAHTLDRKNPVVLLSMALSYMHQMFKRQNENRHVYVLQGWAFFQAYADSRTDWAADKGPEVVAEIKHEIEFNRARCWHMLGMSDLAIQSYDKLLLRSEHQEMESLGYSMESAYALQTIYALSGNMGMAKRVTERYLVVE